MEKVFKIYKKQGETPLEALLKLRKERGFPLDISMTYAGRLDPMAEGLLLILVGEECKKKEDYLGMDKEYEVEVLFGFKTDTGDVLGKVKKPVTRAVLVEKKPMEVLKSFERKFIQEYPAFSSKTVGGEAVFSLAKKGLLPEEMPTKEIEVYKIELEGEIKINARNLLKNIQERVCKVNGDFRQEEILEDWKEVLVDVEEEFLVIKIKVSCSSGTYMRVLAEKIGEAFGCDALAFSIKRTKIGDFHI